MVAVGVDGTRALLTDMRDRIRRCSRCSHFYPPELSGGYCTERIDLPFACGRLQLLRRITAPGASHPGRVTVPKHLRNTDIAQRLEGNAKSEGKGNYIKAMHMLGRNQKADASTRASKEVNA